MATATQPHSIAQFHGLGLLTTVASLPPKYRSRYLSVKTKCETPLDLSVKPLSPTPAAITTITTTTTTSKASPQIANDVPIATTFTEVYTEPETAPTTTTTTTTTMSVAVPTPDSETAEHEHTAEQMFVEEEVVIMTELQPQKQTQTAQQTDLTVAAAAVVTTATPPLSPAGKRKYIELTSEEHEKLPASTTMTKVSYEHPAKMAKTRTNATITRVATPTKPIRGSESATRPGKTATPSTKPTRTKATRKLKFDEETSSPVSGTIIRPLEDITDGTMQYSNGDIDPKYNIVEITEETKAELAAIKNVIGDYVCKLCRIKFDDAFGLARHRCACIVLLEYRCPECGKQFNCPANLASHRRWHKPKKEAATTTTVATVTTTVRKENRNTINQQQTSQQTLVGKKSKDEFAYACSECGKKFKRQAYLRKHQQTHAKSATSAASGKENIATATTTTTTTATIVATFQTAPYISSASVSSSAASCASTHEDEGVYVERTHGYDYDADSLSDECSSTSSSAGYGRLQIVENGLTEEESIAAAALTNLRNCASVIQHTTMAH